MRSRRFMAVLLGEGDLISTTEHPEPSKIVKRERPRPGHYTFTTEAGWVLKARSIDPIMFHSEERR